MPRAFLRTLLVLLFPALVPAQELRVEAPSLVLAGVPFAIEVQAVDAEGNRIEAYEGRPALSGLSESPTGLVYEAGAFAVDDAAGRGRDPSDQETQNEGQAGRDETDAQGDPGAVDQPGEDVPTELVGSQEEGPAVRRCFGRGDRELAVLEMSRLAEPDDPQTSRLRLR